MTSQSETGHAKNAAQFANIIEFCKGYGAKYQPASATLEIAQLETLLLGVNTALAESKNLQFTFNLATNKRFDSFSALRPLAQRMIYALSASGANELSVNEAKTIYRKIQGRRAKTIAEPGEPGAEPKKTNSVSQVSFDNLLANFSALLMLINQITAYQPNEPDLQPDSLNNYLTALQTANMEVINTYTLWSNSRIVRDELMYANDTGMVDIAMQIKAYLKSVYGISSPQFKQISSIRFKRTKD